MSYYILFDHNTHTAYTSVTFQALTNATGVSKRRLKYLLAQNRPIKGFSMCVAHECKLSGREKNMKSKGFKFQFK